VWSNRIVGYSIDSRMKSQLAVTALNNAVARRGDVAGCVVHTDRGSQFQSRKFVRALKRHDMVGSMGRVGAAGDNAAMESFFSLLQKNILDRRTWTTRDDLRIAIVTWIERTYHRRRRQDTLGRLTPIEYEIIMTTPASQAAWLTLSPIRAADPFARCSLPGPDARSTHWRRGCGLASRDLAASPEWPWRTHTTTGTITNTVMTTPDTIATVGSHGSPEPCSATATTLRIRSMTPLKPPLRAAAHCLFAWVDSS
jgi:hypothetical protein